MLLILLKFNCADRLRSLVITFVKTNHFKKNMTVMYKTILTAIDKVLSENKAIRSEADILQAIRSSVPENYKLSGMELAEWYAFASLEDSKYKVDNWDSYFGPPYARYLDGTIRSSYTLQDINKDIIIYWKQRSKECNHPVLIARYAGLVYSLGKKVTEIKTEYDTVKLYIENQLKSVTKGYFSNPLICYHKLERVIDLASRFGLDIILQESIEAVRNIEKLNAKQENPGTWIKSFEILIDKKFEISPDLTNEIIDELAHRFNLSLEPNKEGIYNLAGSEAAFSKLAPYFRKHKLTENLDNLLKAMSDQYWAAAKIAKPMMANYYYEKLLDITSKYGEKKQLSAIYRAIQCNNPKVLEEMRPFPIEFEIPMDMVNNLTEEVLSGDIYSVLGKLAIGFIFNPYDVFSSVDNNSNFAAIITRTLHDSTGRKIATVKPVDQDKEGQIINYYGTFLKVTAAIVHYPIKGGIERGIISVENVMQFLKQSYTINPSKYVIIEKGIEAYLKGDYIVSLHLMIPQVEAACLSILDNAGQATITNGKNDGMNWRIMDNIINDKGFITEVGNDISIYLRTIFTSNLGWNLRNLICHGITEDGLFSEAYADRVFLALLYFGLHQSHFETEISVNKK